MIVFYNQYSEYFAFLEFKQIIISLFRPDLLEDSLQAILIPYVEETSVTLLVVKKRIHRPGKQKPLKVDVFLLKFLERNARGTAKHVLHWSLVLGFGGHGKGVDSLEECEGLLG